MTGQEAVSPAEQAATQALGKVFKAIDEGKSFRLEAGAGAGKTYTLVKALRHLIDTRGAAFHNKNQRIACITYTNVAKEEIKARTDNHPVVLAETIHAFSWSVIRDFQKVLRSRIPELSDKWRARIDEVGGVGCRTVTYTLGYPKVTDSEIFLHHDDVIKLMVYLLHDHKFKLILASRFPIILIDEYQDTNKYLAEAFKTQFIETGQGPLIGLFGDHWQKIYGSASCGLVSSSVGALEVIGKNANFRSDRLIVESLNKIRPDLVQHVSDPNSEGEVQVFHSNSWAGSRQTGAHWAGDLPPADAHQFLESLKAHLSENGWHFSQGKTKILMLTNNVLAAEQGYSQLASVFGDPDDYLKKGNDYIAFLVDTVELGCSYFERGEFGEMFRAFNLTPRIRNHAEKADWNRDLRSLLALKETGTIGDVIDLLKNTQKPRLPAKLEQKERKLSQIIDTPVEDRSEDDIKLLERTETLKAVPYRELNALSKYIDDKTIFSTKHGVKGAEFENVVIVCGRGWNQYNWNQMLEWENSGIPAGKEETFERSRNLFYVACSRPKKRLTILFTQELSNDALTSLSKWFGSENVHALHV